MGARFFLALAYAEIGCLAALSFFPVAPNAPSAIVGYPLYANFPVSPLFQWYTAQAIALPLLTLAIHGWLNRKHPTPAVALDFEIRPLPLWFFRAATGLALTLAVALLGDRYSPSFLLWGTVAYTATLFLLAHTKKRADTIVQRAAIPLCAWLPWLVSRATTVQIQNQSAQNVPWFPFALSAALWAALQITALRKPRWERSAVFWLVLPLILFLFHAQLPEPRWFIHLYHDGESLVTGQLLKRGLFPWRDFVFFHGLLLDPFMGWFGLTGFQPSLWGVDAGVSLVLRPLSLAILWLGLRRLIPQHPLFLLLFFFLGPTLFPTFAETYNLRFLLLPLFWIGVQEVLERRSRLASRALGMALAVQLILAPETLFYGAAVALTLVLFEGGRREEGFLRTRGLLEGGILSSILLGIWLASHRALGPFVQFHLNLASQYWYATAIPLKWELGTWFFVAIGVVVGTHAGFAVLFWQRWRRRALTARDWSAFSLQLFSILYFRKFIYRADEHILAHYALALPVLFWLVGEAMDNLRWRDPKLYRAGIGLLAALAFTVASPAFEQKISRWPARWHQTLAPQSDWPLLGFHSPGRDLAPVLKDWEKFLNEFPGETAFDFTNEPALFYGFLGLRPPSRYLSSFAATTLPAQQEIIDDLERSRPRFAIFASRLGYATLDTVPGPVRHHRVAAYLLAHYRPFRDLGHHWVFERRAPTEPWNSTALPYEPCHWGFSVEALDRSALSLGPGQSGEFRPVPGAVELRAPADSGFLEMEFTAPQPGTFVLGDRPAMAPSDPRAIVFSSSGKGRALIPVGSCPQWHGRTGEKLYLSSTETVTLKSLRWMP